MSRLIVVGSTNQDLILAVPRIPGPGETVAGTHFSSASGGKGANQAIAAARAGGKVVFITRVGREPFGMQCANDFVQEGIDIRHLFFDPHENSGTAMIYVDDEGENCIGIASGANANLSIEDVQHALKDYPETQILLTQLEIPLSTVDYSLQWSKDHGVTTILDPAPAQNLTDALLANVDMITPNLAELALLTNRSIESKESIVAAAKSLLKRGVGQVIVTMGGKGVLRVANDAVDMIPAHPVKAIDTTAAGDIFNGALAVALSEGEEIIPAIRFASAAAEISVQRSGAQPSAPQRYEINAVFESEK